MNAGALTRHIDDYYLSLKTLRYALASLLTLAVAVIILAGFLGTPPLRGPQTIVSLQSEKTVAVNSGDLNQLDLKTPPPAPPSPAIVTDAGKPQPHDIEDAIAGLHEATPYGLAPVVRVEDHMTAFRAYASPFTPAVDTKGTVSFVMVDFGLSDKISQSGITDLPSAVTFLLDTNAKNAQKWTSDARRYSHEVWVSLPLQTNDYPQIDTGPKTIIANMDPTESNKRLLQTLGVSTGYAGVIINNANAFASLKDQLQKVLASVSARGLAIAQSDPADKSTSDMAAAINAPFTQNNTWIAQISSEKDLQTKFIDIESSAVKNKKIVVFFRPYPATIKAIQNFAKDSASRGIQLAPLSATIK